METINERLRAVKTTVLFDIAHDYKIPIPETYSELVNKIESAIYCGNISIDDIIKEYPNF